MEHNVQKYKQLKISAIFAGTRLFYWAKVIPCLFVKQGCPFGFWEKSPRLSFASGSISPKNLA